MKYLTFLFFLFYYKYSWSQNKPDTIHWRPDYNLKWQDFKGRPDSSSEYAAISWIGPIITSRFITDTSIGFNVFCVFYKSLSWIKNNDTSNYLLQHEQGHFDIAEAYGRKLKQDLKILESINYIKNEAIVKEKKEIIVNRILKDKDSLNHVYDSETEFSTNYFQQRIWMKKIAGMLENTNTTIDTNVQNSEK